MPVELPESTPPPDPSPVQFRWNLRFAAVVCLCLPLLLALGFWQLARAAEKEQTLRAFEAQRAAPPIPIGQIDAQEGARLDGRRVALHGRYLPENAFLLDNRVLGGRVGYELLMPFADRSGLTVLVNRGWLPAPPTRDRLPEVETPEGQLALSGEIHVPSSNTALELWATDGWPSVVQNVDVPALSQRAGLKTFAYLVRLEPSQPGVTEADWPRVNMTPDRHRAYATQWFLMAVVLLLVFMSGGTNLPAWLAARKKH